MTVGLAACTLFLEPQCQSSQCEPFGCAPNGECATTCNERQLCAYGADCLDGMCVVQCVDSACTPYRCLRGTPDCLETCVGRQDCSSGYFCCPGEGGAFVCDTLEACFLGG